MFRFRHIVRLFGLLIGGIALFLVVRTFLVPPSFDQIGQYRAAHLTEATEHPLRHSGDDACLDCHDKEWDIVDGRHGAVPCEACHYNAGPHAAEAERSDGEVDAEAEADARAQARLAFDTLYAAMAGGWSKDEIDRLVTLIDKGAGAMRIRLWRGRAVADQYGPRRQETPPDKHLEKVFADGAEATINEGDDLRFLYPIKAGEECLACHTAAPGSVNGVIEVIYPGTKLALMKFQKITDMDIDRSPEPCLRCHLQNGARPENFPDITERAEHVEENWKKDMGSVDEKTPCLTCHKAHYPRIVKKG